jgi:hypothetical protein
MACQIQRKCVVLACRLRPILNIFTRYCILLGVVVQAMQICIHSANLLNEEQRVVAIIHVSKTGATVYFWANYRRTFELQGAMARQTSDAAGVVFYPVLS